MKTFKVTADSYNVLSSIKFFRIRDEEGTLCCRTCVKTIFYDSSTSTTDLLARCAFCHICISIFIGDTIEYPCPVVTV